MIAYLQQLGKTNEVPVLAPPVPAGDVPADSDAALTTTATAAVQ